jgi:pseudaminic acid synthase
MVFCYTQTMPIKIANNEIGENSPVFIIAELSANHNQNFDLAVETIKAAKASGADAIKLQTYTADTITIDCDNKYFQINQGTIWDGKTLYSLYQEAYTPWDWQPKLKKIAEDLGLICFSSPFDKTAVDFLEEMNVPAYKIASFEITDLPLIEYTASKQKPIIISTGIASLSDIQTALDTCYKTGNKDVILLKCTSAYPAPYEEINLKTIPTLEKKFKTIVGLSDHTMGNSVAIASVALGAKVIEKHFILDRNKGGPDAAFSAEPKEFKEMVNAIRIVEKAIGTSKYSITEKMKTSKTFSRSLFAVQDIKKDEVFNEKNIRSIRPGYGLHPKHLIDIIGKTAKNNISKGTPMSWNLIN